MEYKSKQYYKEHPEEYISYVKEVEKKRIEQEENSGNEHKEELENQFLQVQKEYLEVKEQYQRANSLNIISKHKLHKDMQRLKNELSLINSQLGEIE